MPVVEINCLQPQERVKTSGFRCRIQTNSNCMNNTSQLNHKRACPIADMYAPKSMSPGDRMLPSRHENVTNCQSLSQREYSRDVCNHGNKLLIHHQRHSLKNRFHLLRTLGEGTYGKVKLAADRGTGEHVAIKYIRKTKIQDENDRARIRREIRILSSLKHRHVVSIREVFEKKDKIVLVMDYIPGGELYDYLDKMSPLSERESRRIFRQLVSAVHYCHENGIVHRDLKLENIILDEEGNVKMADFGLSNYYSQTTKLSTFCGSPLYASPEIVNGQPYHGPEVDVWSLGVILYTLVYGAMPFESANLVLLKRQITTGNYSQPSPPSDAAGLIRHMLTVTPSRRANLDDILHHWWVNLGYPNMPNDMPYNPEHAPTIRTARRDSVESSGNAHDSCNSSISSDSDAEIDLQTLNRFAVHVNNCNTASSPSDVPLHYRRTKCPQNSADSSVTLSTSPIFSPDVSEISKGCRTAFISSNNNSSTFNGETNVCVKSGDLSSADDCAQTPPSTFDSEKKPAKGILKRKGKFSGGDSGCVMPEDMATKIEDIHGHEFDDLSRDLDSLTVSSCGEFDENEQGSCYPNESNPHCVQSKTCDSSVSQVDWSNHFSQSLKRPQQNQQQLPHQPKRSTNSKDFNIVRNRFNGTVPGDASTSSSHLTTPAITRHESISRL